MLCDHCHAVDATIYLTQVINDEVKKLHLCKKCASELGLDMKLPGSMKKLLLGMGSSGNHATDEHEVSGLHCPGCGMTREDYRMAGRLGCPTCYITFADDLMPYIRAMHHRATSHLGKRPGGESAEPRENKVPLLRKHLQQAIADERYEEAARLRDEIVKVSKRDQGQ